MYKVKNINIYARLGVPTMERIIHYRRLIWMQKIALMPITRTPRLFLNAWIANPRPVGRPNLTTRDSFIQSLQYCDSQGFSDFQCPNGKLNKWVPLAQNKKTWKEMTDKLRKVRTLNDVDFYKTYYNSVY